MNQNHKTGCLVCGQELVYLAQNEPQTCLYCGGSFDANVRCRQGHYICDACHSLGANDLIETFCRQTASVEPLEMAVTLMAHASIHMHGPEHHFLVPAVLLSAYYNQLGRPEEKARRLEQARKRAEQVPGGFCGMCGNCGAGVGTGIFVSLITGSTPLAKREWSLSNRMTAQSLLAIAEHGGPRCCKRDTYLALGAAVAFLKDNFAVSLPFPANIQCSFYPSNKECLAGDCPFYPG